jgi:CheY-like chemotaxis protein
VDRRGAARSNGSDKDKERALAAGFDEHVTKPADIVELCQQLHAMA